MFKSSRTAIEAVRALLRRTARSSILAGLLAGTLLFGGAYALARRDSAYVVAARHAHVHHTGPTFRLRVSPHSQTTAAGWTAVYRITIRRVHFGGTIRLKVIGGLPPGATASLKPGRASRSHSRLTIRTSGATPPGIYVVRLRARRGRVRRTVQLTLIVQGSTSSPGNLGATAASTTSGQFTISGGVADPLLPGLPQAIDVVIANPNPQPLTLENLGVAITSLDAPRSTGTLPCTLADFSVAQYSGPSPLTIPASSTENLQQLGVPPVDWPQLALLNLPRNQDGCQRASLTLSYTGQAASG